MAWRGVAWRGVVWCGVWGGMHDVTWRGMWMGVWVERSNRHGDGAPTQPDSAVVAQ
jgi:hypothetical protein